MPLGLIPVDKEFSRSDSFDRPYGYSGRSAILHQRSENRPKSILPNTWVTTGTKQSRATLNPTVDLAIRTL